MGEVVVLRSGAAFGPNVLPSVPPEIDRWAFFIEPLAPYPPRCLRLVSLRHPLGQQ
jgi:hypothetical protein